MISKTETYKEGRDDTMIMSSINAVDIHRLSWSPAADVQVETVADHQDDDPDAIEHKLTLEPTCVALTNSTCYMVIENSHDPDQAL